METLPHEIVVNLRYAAAIPEVFENKSENVRRAIDKIFTRIELFDWMSSRKHSFQHTAFNQSENGARSLNNCASDIQFENIAARCADLDDLVFEIGKFDSFFF